MSAAYDPNNVFAKILRGEMPAHKVYETDKVLAFMDIMPRADGHVLVIPRRPRATFSTSTPTISPNSPRPSSSSPRA